MLNLRRARDVLRHPRLGFLLAVIAFLVASPGFLIGWQMDDYMMRFNLRGFEGWGGTHLELPSLFGLSNGNEELLGEIRDLGAVPWWTPDDLRLAFWRPVAEATHRLDAALAPGSAAIAHLHSLLWFSAVAALLLFTYRRLFEGDQSAGWAAGLAALLWVVDDARAMPAAWVANRNSMIAVFFGLLALVAHLHWRRGGGWAFCAAAMLSLALALLSAEAGLATTAYLFAFACCLDPAESWPRRLGSLVPYALVVLLWRLAYQAQGFGADRGRFYLDPVRQPIEFLTTAAERLPVLFLGQWALPPAESSILFPPERLGIIWVSGVLLAVLLAIVFRPLLVRDARARFLAVGMGLSFLPICAVQPGDRNLAFVGVGAAGLLALFLAGLADRAPWSEPAATPRLRRAVAGGLVAIHLVLAPILFPIMIAGVAQLGNPVARAAREIEIERYAGRDLVLLNAPDFFYADMVAVIHGLEDRPLPRTIRPLVLGPSPLTVTRVDDRSLRVRAPDGVPGGMFAGLFRDPSNRLEPGDVVVLSGLTVEVEEVLEEGWIGQALFRFDVALEDQRLGWLRFADERFVPFVPPVEGESVELPGAWSRLEAQIQGALGGGRG